MEKKKKHINYICDAYYWAKKHGEWTIVQYNEFNDEGRFFSCGFVGGLKEDYFDQIGKQIKFQ
jgi:hypothetical protein